MRQMAMAVADRVGNPLHTVGPFRALGHRFTIRTNVGVVGRHLWEVFGELHDAEAAPAGAYLLEELPSEGRPRYRSRWGAEVFADSEDPAHALAMLLWDVNRRAVETTSDKVLLHAAGGVRDGGAVVLPAPMESGKTTLIAGLVARGFGYLSDELIAIPVDSDSAEVHGYAKALSLDPGSWDVLPELRPAIEAGLAMWMPPQWQVPPRAIRREAVVPAAPPRFVVFPRYEAGATTALVPLGRAEAVIALADCTFGFQTDGARALPVLARLIASSRCYRLRVGDLRSACRAIMDLYEEDV